MTELAAWLTERRQACDMVVERIPFSASGEWHFVDGTLRHRTGAFFSVVGLRVDAPVPLEQPMIDQPEVGLLGFVVRDGGEGGVHVLVQAKPEPGNVGLVQLAPSVQATESNFTRRHGGRPTPLLDAFASGAPLVADVLQSEQGTRFLGKYNRNAVVRWRGSAEAAETEHLQWFPFREVQQALLEDFAVNTDARSVLATCPWRVLAGAEPFARWQQRDSLGARLHRSWRSADQTVATRVETLLAHERERRRFCADVVPLPALGRWHISAERIHDGDSLHVEQVSVTSSEREVPAWDQPLVGSTRHGATALLVQERDGTLRFLFAARAEPGFREHVQLGPSVQSEAAGPALFPDLARREAALTDAMRSGSVLLSVQQSDEGGRFMRSVDDYRIVEVAPDALIPTGGAVWLTAGEIDALVARPGWFSNEARSLISMLVALV